VTNGVDHTVTRNLTISVNSLTLSAHPQDITTSNPYGENLSVTATASGALSYQWFKDSNAITGANSRSYRATQDGTYHVVVTSTLNGVTRSETSTTATFAMNTVSIATQPTAALVADGSTNTFSVVATGSGTLTYQWIRNSSQISGATSDTFISGVYGNHEVVVTSTLNGHTTSVTSNSVLLDVNTVTITSGPADSYMTQGGTKSLGVSVSSHGSATISYQWYFNDAEIAGENGIGIYANQAGEYKVKVTSVRGGSTFSRFSSTATVTEVPPPVISSFTSASSSVGLGNSTQITAVFSGGTGVITPGDIPVSSGDTITVTPTVSTSYTLSVQNPAGTQSGHTIRVSVMTGTFAAVSNVSSADRYDGARAITLPSGKVVVFGSYAYTNITDVYNPTTNSFTRVGDMARGRHRFATALLNDGKVLAIGGMYQNGATYTSLATVEIFDPITETWSYTGSLNVAREGAVAVVLPNGKVLVTGGMMRAPGTTYLSSAEIYDPATGLFTYVNSMPQARGSATGALMADGRVFIAGGYNGTNGHMKSAVIYNPSLNTWTTVTSQMNSVHSEGGAVTLLMNDGRMIVAGGWNPSNGVWTIDVYNPTTISFVAGANLPQFSHGRGGITGHVLSNGLVAFIGGSSALGDIANTIVLYDPVANTMATEANTMSVERYRQASALLSDGRIIIIGGSYWAKTAAEVYTQ
jgi:N-acetylneuraminic acid mutarotase